MAALRQRGALIAVLLGFFIVMLDATVVNVVRCLVFLGQWWKEYCFER